MFFFKGEFFKRLKRVVKLYILIESKYLYPGNSNSSDFSAPSWRHMEVFSFLSFHAKINKHTIISWKQLSKRYMLMLPHL